MDFDMDLPQIPKFYSGRNIFITGGTGLMGKVLIERLLATCPDIGLIYLLMRHKKNSNPEERLGELKLCQVFEVIRQNSPWQLEKLRVIAGDVTRSELGMLPDSLISLREVSIIFHSAACVKLQEPLRIAINHNLRPVIELLKICNSLPSLEVFVYVSTAYSNAELNYIEEKVYPAPMTLDNLFNLVENTSDIEMEKMTQKYIHPKQNTYTFTKAMAEHEVAEHAKKENSYSSVIFRPTIVVSSLKHPFPGWIENFNGPTGFIVGSGKGLLHVITSCEKMCVDLLPVDIAIDTLIAVAWDAAVEKTKSVRVYNCSVAENPTTIKQLTESVIRGCRNYPLGRPLWYPYGISTKNRYLRKILQTCLQTLPLCAVGYISRVIGIKMPIDLILTSQKLVAMNDVMTFVMTREWDFETNNVKRLFAKLSAADAIVFNLDAKTINWDKFYIDYICGIKRYMLKISDKDLSADRKHIRMLCVLHYSAIISLIIFILRIVTKKFCTTVDGFQFDEIQEAAIKKRSVLFSGFICAGIVLSVSFSFYQ